MELLRVEGPVITMFAESEDVMSIRHIVSCTNHSRSVDTSDKGLLPSLEYQIKEIGFVM